MQGYLRQLMATLAGLLIVVCTELRADTIINVPPAAIPFVTTSYAVTAGTTLNIFDGAEVYRTLSVKSGANVNVYGGELRQPINVDDGASINILGGGLLSYELSLSTGSHAKISGGRFTRNIFKQLSATLILEGVDFALNGMPVSGLDQPGDEVAITVPQETFFTGIFADGGPFNFYQGVASGDRLYGEVVLRRSVRPTGPPTIHLPADPAPPGVMPGQTVIVEDGGVLPQGTAAAAGSFVEIRGGEAVQLRALGGQVLMSGGVSSIEAYPGSTIHLTGGRLAVLSTWENTDIVIDGGNVGTLAPGAGTDIRIAGGSIEAFYFRRGVRAVVTGGEIERFSQYSGALELRGGRLLNPLALPSGAEFVWAGGRIAADDYARIYSHGDAEITILANGFSLDGAPISGLESVGDSLILPNRGGEMLDIAWLDGTTGHLLLQASFPVPTPEMPQTAPTTFISSQTTLRLVLVPEPSGLVTLPITVMAWIGMRRRCS